MDPTQRVLLEGAEQVARMGSWDWDLVTNELVWSDNLFRLFGLEPGEIAPSLEYLFAQVHPDDRRRVERQAEAAQLTGKLEPTDWRIVLPDGEVRHLRSTTAVVQESNGRPRRMIGTVQDLTDQRRADRTIAAHHAVSESLADWESLDRSGERLVGHLAEALDCVAAAMWVPDGETMVARVFWRSSSVDLSALDESLRGLRLSAGAGLAGRAWESGEPVSAVPLLDQTLPALRDGIAAASLASGLAFPARHRDEVLVVLALYSKEELRPSEDLIRSLTGIGYEIGAFLDRRRGELAPPVLTPREVEVLQLATRGLSARRIAGELFVSPATVRTHLEHIYSKYGVSDRASAVAKALRAGLIE